MKDIISKEDIAHLKNHGRYNDKDLVIYSLGPKIKLPEDIRSNIQSETYVTIESLFLCKNLKEAISHTKLS